MTDLLHRPRRLRKTENLRALVRETRLAPEDFILPLFACAGEKVRREIPSMPGVHNLSVDEVAKEAAAAYDLGVKSVILFGLPETKDEFGSGAYHENGIVQQAIRAIRAAAPGLVIMADTCLCEYTSHGHCGVVREGEVLNDPSLELLARTAVSQAEAGADLVAPSAMLDGQVGIIRDAPGDGLRGEVCVGLLWSISRSGRQRAGLWRSPRLSNGCSERPRSYA